MPLVTSRRILLVTSLINDFDQAPHFILDTDMRPLQSGVYDIWVLQFHDGSRVCVRVPVRMQCQKPNVIAKLVENEISILDGLARANFLWSPRPITYSLDFNNHLRYPYMVLSWIDGKPLKWSDEIPLKAARDKVLRQLASITFELLRCTAMEEDNSWTAEAFLVNLIDKRARRVLHEGVEGLDFQDCISLRVIARILSKMPNKFYLHENPPGCSYRTNFPVNLEKTAAISAISHDDLSAKNIIVDKDYNVKGLINWTCAKQLPVRYAVRLPQLLGPDFKKPDPEDSWRGWEVVPPSEMLQKDREGFVDHLTWILLDEAPGSTISELAPLACDRDDIDWKHLAFLAVFMTNIHHKVVQKQFLMRKTMIWDALSPGTWERMLQQEMVSFYYDQLDMPEDMDNGEPSVRAAHPPVSLVTNDIC